MLLIEKYKELDLKGKYAVFQLIEALINEKRFGVTLLSGHIDRDIKTVLDSERNDILKNFGGRLFTALQNVNTNL